MIKHMGIVVGIDKQTNSFRVIYCKATEIDKNKYSWEFKCEILNETQLVYNINNINNLTWLNVKTENNKIKGSGGSLDRFDKCDNNHRPFVILSQLQSSDSRLLGYKIANFEGQVKNITIKEILAYGNRINKLGGIPIQNAIFVPAEKDKREHFKSYPNHSFLVEVIEVNKNKHADNRKSQVNKNNKTLTKLEEIYNKEQIEELKQGKKNGIDIRVYANPALSSEQMKVIRAGLEQGLPVKCIAFPDYKVEVMRYYIQDLKAGMDIRKYLNPKYDLGQISELSLAYESGVDISKMSNPKLSASDMAEIRERLEANIWKDEFVRKDGSWF